MTMTIDPQTMLEQIVQRVLKSTAEGTEGSLPATVPDDPEAAFVQLVGDRLAEMLAGGSESPSVGEDETPPDGPPYELLLERSCALATALGACDCWGDDARCPICRGAGGPGWTVPDRHFFTEFVLPALDVLQRSRRKTHSLKPRGGDNGRPVRA